MLARAHRLRHTHDIVTTLRRGTRRSAGSVSAVYLSKPAPVRATVIVDKKVSKRAVVRNKIKRRMRALLREQLPESGDLVVRAFPGAEKVPFPDLKQQLTTCLRGSVRS
jgi:ribonuclease P protein component